MSTPSIARVPHVHAEVIKAWASGGQVETFSTDDNIWVTLSSPFFWNESKEYRIKPEKVYPVTGLSHNALADIYFGAFDFPVKQIESTGAVAIANAALRHAIDADQVISRVGHQDALVALSLSMRMGETARHAARDMAIAAAVRRGLNREDISDASLRAIIAGVRPC